MKLRGVYARILFLFTVSFIDRAASQSRFWQRIETPFSIVETPSYRVYSRPEPKSILAMDSKGNMVMNSKRGLYLSTNDGGSWLLRDTAFTLNVKVLTFSPKGDIILSTDQGALFRSTNLGESFTRENSSLRKKWIVNDETGSMISGNARSVDDGHSWNVMDDHVVPDWIGLTPKGVMLGQVSNFGKSSGDEELRVFRSFDHSKRWQPVYLHEGRKENIELIMSTGTEIVFVQKEKNLFRSLNFGKTWLPADSGLEELLQRDMEGLGIHLIFGVSGTTIFAASMGDGIFRSTNSGRSWCTLDKGLEGHYVGGLLLNPKGLLFTVTSNGIYRSVMPVTSKQAQKKG